MTDANPSSAWKSLRDGNTRFVQGAAAQRRNGFASWIAQVGPQSANAVIFGCSDAGLDAEIVLDQRAGAVTSVCTAGHVVDSVVLGSIEHAIHTESVSLIVVLGHDRCASVRATLGILDGDPVPAGSIRHVFEKIAPSVLIGRRKGCYTVDQHTRHHLMEVGNVLIERSTIISQRIIAGECAIVAATLTPPKGRITLHGVIGNFGETRPYSTERRS